jgi:hypothetical protein
MKESVMWYVVVVIVVFFGFFFSMFVGMKEGGTPKKQQLDLLD